MKTYLIIEHYKKGKSSEIYDRFSKNGRMLPEGVVYIDSWVTVDLSTCYQIMTCDVIDKLHLWILHWEDLVDFDIIPVMSSNEARTASINSEK